MGSSKSVALIVTLHDTGDICAMTGGGEKSPPFLPIDIAGYYAGKVYRLVKEQ